MSTPNDRHPDKLTRLIGRELELGQETETGSENFMRWLAHEARAAQTTTEREHTDHQAIAFARRMGPRIKAKRISNRLPRQHLQRRSVTAVAGLRDAITIAAQAGCAPLLDMSVAAGSGRALWDEPCEEWIEVPMSLPDGQYLGLKVSGRSMLPLLEQGDVILVKVGAMPSEDDLVVAQSAENEYVVKRVAAVSGSSLLLESLNPEYPSFSVSRDARTVLGTVIARFHSA